MTNSKVGRAVHRSDSPLVRLHGRTTLIMEDKDHPDQWLCQYDFPEGTSYRDFEGCLGWLSARECLGWRLQPKMFFDVLDDPTESEHADH